MTEEATSLPRLLTLKLIRTHYLPLAERTIYRMLSTGQFPPADIQEGGKIRLWRRETVEAWVDERAGSLAGIA
jgi:predicted DNA-binding transcriptional regulator AlpA